jgi:DNA-binding CsgD family transcriptional regulator
MHTAIEVHPTRYFQDILQIVDCIYAAACGETPWKQTVAEVCEVGKLDGCALSVIDALERRRVVLASCELSSAAEPDAMVGPMRGNPPLADSVLRSTPGAVWQDRQIMSDALPTTTLSWADWAQAKGRGSWACVIVGRDERQVVCLEVFAGARRAASRPALDDFLRQLAPHLTRAWRLDRTSRSMLAAPSGAASPSQPDPDAACAPDFATLPEDVRLRAEFGLTKAEARLALRLAEGSSLASAARAFNVKLTTIRSQLQQVFSKTGTARQTELMAMLLSRGYGSRRPPSRHYRSIPAELAVAG